MTLICVLLVSWWGFQEPERPARSERDAVLAAIVAAQGRIAEAMVDVDVTGHVTYSFLGTRRLQTPISGGFRYRTTGNRVLIDMPEGDVDQPVMALPKSPDDHGSLDTSAKQLPRVKLSRLYLPHGMTETFNHDTETLVFRERQVRNPRFQYSVIAPHDYLWAFATASRERLLQSRKLTITETTGRTPNRIVTVVAKSETNEAEFRFREDWGWVPDRCDLLGVVSGQRVSGYRTEIVGVHQTRLGTFPRHVRHFFINYLPDGSTPEVPYKTAAEIRYEKPSFFGIVIPNTLLPEKGRDGDKSVQADTLYARASALASQTVLGRGTKLTEFLTRAKAEVPQLFRQDPGARRLGARCMPAAVLASLLSLVIGGWLFLQGKSRRARWLLTAAAVSAVLAMAGKFGFGGFGTPRSASVVISAPEFRTRHLCGVDTLFGFFKCVGDSQDYLQVLRLIRPSTVGTDLQRIHDVASALGCDVRIVDAREFSRPPIPAILHLAEGHFILALGCREDEVLCFDPALGILSYDWGELLEEVSGPTLTSA